MFDFTIPKKKKCPHCGEMMEDHIVKEGARFHVPWWSWTWDSVNFRYVGMRHCSEARCEDNHGQGHCVPFKKVERSKGDGRGKERWTGWVHQQFG